jgi:hypothetical protein
MATDSKHQRIWLNMASGVAIPGGTSSEWNQSSSQTYLSIKDKAIAIEQLYSMNQIPLPTTSELARLIKDAKNLSDSWLTNRINDTPMTTLFRVGHFDRIAEAILPLTDVPDRSKYLTALGSGNFDLLKRVRSATKDLLWEVELWAMLRKRSLNATLCEPPDIVIRFEDATVGIACKKLYSEKHVQNVLSQAVGQIETTFDFGIVALNLDDLVPQDQILRSPNQRSMGQFINNLNIRFLQRHERYFRKYLSSGRILSALVSTSVLADVQGQGTRFNNARQVTMWTIPGLPEEKQKQLKRLYVQLMQ